MRENRVKEYSWTPKSTLRSWEFYEKASVPWNTSGSEQMRLGSCRTYPSHVAFIWPLLASVPHDGIRTPDQASMSFGSFAGEKRPSI
jgi:hypothetical protein